MNIFKEDQLLYLQRFPEKSKQKNCGEIAAFVQILRRFLRVFLHFRALCVYGSFFHPDNMDGLIFHSVHLFFQDCFENVCLIGFICFVVECLKHLPEILAHADKS